MLQELSKNHEKERKL